MTRSHCTTEGVSSRLSRWVAELDFERLPAVIRNHARQQILDTVCVGWAGSNADGAEIFQRLMQARAPLREARIWGTDQRAGRLDAALLNGISAAALDFDSVHNVATVHSAAVVLPALLALGEAEHRGGREVLTAFVAGSEVMARLSSAMQTHPGWFYTSVVGVMATAAACAKLLGLDAKGIQTSIGAALSRAAGTQQTLLERTLTKRMQSAFAARDGLECALLASYGVSAPGEAIEGTFGLAKLYSPMDQDSITNRLGSDFAMLGVGFKAYPSCLCNHAAISAALEILNKHPLDVREIDTVEVTVTPFMMRLVGAPFEPGTNPQVTAQFSVQYSVACVLLRGRLTVADLDPQRVRDAAIRELCERISVRVNEEESGKFSPATVRVRLRNGTSLERTGRDFPGAPGREMTTSQIVDKARDCFSSGLTPLSGSAIGPLVDQLLAFDSVPDVRSVLNI